jgi:hypothetical protein
MRYIAKIHVLDVLDHVVVSGYVYDADPLSDPDHEPLEFTYESAGKGLDDRLVWLQWHLYDAFQTAIRALSGDT